MQARLASSRLPGKVLLAVAGHSLLSRVVRRVTRAHTLDQTVVATTEEEQDDEIVAECARLGVSCVRGDQADVLDRYRKTALATNAAVVVRITADCPLIDPGLIDTVVRAYHNHAADYVSNTQHRTWPRGLDVEVFGRAALDHAWREAKEPWQRVHVTPYFYQHPALFRLHSVVAPEDHSHLRWTVDTADDLELVRRIYQHFDPRDDFEWREVLALIQQRPELVRLNQHVQQKALEEG